MSNNISDSDKRIYAKIVDVEKGIYLDLMRGVQTWKPITNL